MNHLIVVAHPSADSFTMGLARSYADELQRLGHRQQTCDLYRMGFDPVLAAQEIAPIGEGRLVPAAVLKAQDDVRAADVLTVIYPLWWLSMPAILKGYIDRVFARGFAYELHKGVVRGLLAGRKAVMITVSGAPLPALVKSGNWNAMQVLQDTHVFRSTGFDLLEHVHFDEVVPQLSRIAAEQHIETVRCCARRHFPQAS